MYQYTQALIAIDKRVRREGAEGGKKESIPSPDEFWMDPE